MKVKYRKSNILNQIKIQSSIYIRRSTSGRAHFRGLAPEQHTWKKRRSGGKLLATASKFTQSGN